MTILVERCGRKELSTEALNIRKQARWWNEEEKEMSSPFERSICLVLTFDFMINFVPVW
jgi:hypothetical protein